MPKGDQSFGEWLEAVNEGLCAADLKPMSVKVASEYYSTGYTPDEVAEIEAGEATAAENAQMEADGEYGREHRYP